MLLSVRNTIVKIGRSRFIPKYSKLRLISALVVAILLGSLWTLWALQPEHGFRQGSSSLIGNNIGRAYTHKFSSTGLGNKFSELLISLDYAHNNGLKYLFDYDSFVANSRHVDYKWFADHVATRYDRLDRNRRLVRVKNLFVPPGLTQNQVAHGYSGFYSESYGGCGDADNCFMAEISFFNKIRDVQDLLDIKVRHHRVAVHLRFGDIGSFSSVAHYQQFLHNLDRVNGETLPEDKLHFVYYTSKATENVLDELRVAFPSAHYHNMKSVQDTVMFLASSQYLITSGSSLSYTAAYLCPDCHVIFTEPKEHFIDKLVDDNLNKTFYYMDEWTPYYKLLDE